MRTQTYHAMEEIAEERERQISEEGITARHDDEHVDGSLALAAAAYAIHFRHAAGLLWPWERESWKPGTRRRNLVKAAALIVAELERLERKGE